MINAIIIEDEKLARDIIRNYLKEFAQINIIGEFEDGFTGLKGINELKPDLIFLDIQMPKLTGFELLELLDYTPNIIFTTAFDEYAIKAFELSAIDYLLKPFSQDRFNKAVEKSLSIIKSETKPPQIQESLNETIENSEHTLNRIVVKNGSRIDIIPTDEVNYIEAQDDYVMIYTDTGNHLKQSTMKYYESHLDNKQFIRIHRSYIVSINQIKEMSLYGKDSHMVVLKCNKELKVSRSRYKELKKELNL